MTDEFPGQLKPVFGKIQTYDFGEFQVLFRFEKPKRRSRSFSIYIKEGIFVCYLSSFRIIDPLSIEAFVRTRKKWFKKVLDEYKSRQETNLILKEKFEKEQVIPYLGGFIPYFVETGKKRSATITPEGLKITIRSIDEKDNADRRMAVIKQILKGWYKEAFRQDLQNIVRETARRVCSKELSEFTYIDVLESVTKWGDYTKRWFLGGDGGFQMQRIRINRQLAYYDRDLLNSIICHELAHIRYQSHGVRFYQLFQKYCPTWRNEEEKLKNISPRNDFLNL